MSITVLEQRALSCSIQVSVDFWCPGAPARRRRGREVVPLRRHCAPQPGQSAFARRSKARCARMRAFFIPHLRVSSSRSTLLIWPFAASSSFKLAKTRSPERRQSVLIDSSTSRRRSSSSRSSSPTPSRHPGPCCSAPFPSATTASGWLLLLLLPLLLLMLLAAAAAVAAAGPSLYFSCFQCLVHTSAKALWGSDQSPSHEKRPRSRKQSPKPVFDQDRLPISNSRPSCHPAGILILWMGLKGGQGG